MVGMLLFVTVCVIASALLLWVAVEFSKPAPAWLEEEEYNNRHRWYK